MRFISKLDCMLTKTEPIRGKLFFQRKNIERWTGALRILYCEASVQRAFDSCENFKKCGSTWLMLPPTRRPTPSIRCMQIVSGILVAIWVWLGAVKSEFTVTTTVPDKLRATQSTARFWSVGFWFRRCVLLVCGHRRKKYPWQLR